MSIRDQLKQREERRDQAANGGSNGNLPEGVTRYVRLGQELKDGKTFVLLANPDNWYFYFTHEDSKYANGRTMTFLRKHTCLNSPREVGADFGKYEKPNKSTCLSCAASAKRKLYFMVPVFDPEYNEWRVLDLKEFHASNLIDDYDKLEKAAQKFQKGYTLAGDAVSVGKTSDGKSYSMSSGELDEAIIAAAKAFDVSTINYAELAFFREVDDIAKILAEATDEAKLDKSVLGANVSASIPKDAVTPVDSGLEIDPDSLPF
ncbi:single-stranded DNA-binding protein [Paenibacillus sp. SC116]|uniref:single-stranded DNA-binding protein n=1 Tax=Paenibacillus sp. SC116 TaxID=2968986 RepID=UPI00215A8BD5|nr:single-stranded DNA-binding protein [Paenibacillus sp. SC116]MCR8843127.1 single-stranded DNA-binding protein [Paenibacillus sp. SC116]